MITKRFDYLELDELKFDLETDNLEQVAFTQTEDCTTTVYYDMVFREKETDKFYVVGLYETERGGILINEIMTDENGMVECYEVEPYEVKVTKYRIKE